MLQVKQAHHNWRKVTHHSKGPAELKRTKTHKTDGKPETQECGHCRGWGEGTEELALLGVTVDCSLSLTC